MALIISPTLRKSAKSHNTKKLDKLIATISNKTFTSVDAAMEDTDVLALFTMLCGRSNLSMEDALVVPITNFVNGH